MPLISLLGQAWSEACEAENADHAELTSSISNDYPVRNPSEYPYPKNPEPNTSP